MNKRILLSAALACLLLTAGAAEAQQRGRTRPKPQRKGAVCGDPTLQCRTGDVKFEPHDLPFSISAQAVIWESEFFYAVILRSVRAAEDDCRKFVPEDERQATQALFPRHKVFTDRACGEPGEVYYTGTRPGTRFMAVYAGRTRAEADAMLARVKATGQFAGANVRRMSIGFNGT
ncbi:MAG TPA: hypothetical protein VEY11_12280 [Pyrinomonadaceae bacterium]|nr:hypothetical protein [Pyrinomonadaceae bacterium]